MQGEWFDDRILPFVRELMASPQSFLGAATKKPPRAKPGGSELRNCCIVLVCDFGETFRESLTLRAATPELALSALTGIAHARLKFLAQSVKITRLLVPGCRPKNVDLRGAFATQSCNHREGLSVILNSEPGNGFSMLGGIKQYANRWFHGVPPELYEAVTRWHSVPTAQCRMFLTQFAQVLNQNHCVIVAQTVLPVRGIFSHGIGSLPRGELRSKVNQKAARKRRPRPAGDVRPKDGLVYFIEDTLTTDVKIGFCQKKPEKRMADLRTGNPNPLRLVGSVRGSKAQEKELHRRFSAYHRKGEWFTSAVLADITEILKCVLLEEWLKRQDSDPLPRPASVPAARVGSETPS
ncbi:MAG: GIY-YIG nuclease family protein [Acidobacteriaceae bacterium]|nr:GIY-YIG nuclease family protein [Acidobacteriaceae bacterium]